MYQPTPLLRTNASGAQTRGPQNLKKLKRSELEELLLFNRKMVSNPEMVSKLSDKGQKILQKIAEIEVVLQELEQQEVEKLQGNFVAAMTLGQGAEGMETGDRRRLAPMVEEKGIQIVGLDVVAQVEQKMEADKLVMASVFFIFGTGGHPPCAVGHDGRQNGPVTPRVGPEGYAGG